jgi:hypothetical protein
MFALSRRRNASEVVVKPKISSSRDAYTVFHSLMGELPYEEFWMLLLNRANKIMKAVKVSEGGISGTVSIRKRYSVSPWRIMQPRLSYRIAIRQGLVPQVKPILRSRKRSKKPALYLKYRCWTILL